MSAVRSHNGGEGNFRAAAQSSSASGAKARGGGVLVLRSQVNSIEIGQRDEVGRLVADMSGRPVQSPERLRRFSRLHPNFQLTLVAFRESGRRSMAWRLAAMAALVCPACKSARASQPRIAADASGRSATLDKSAAAFWGCCSWRNSAPVPGPRLVARIRQDGFVELLHRQIVLAVGLVADPGGIARQGLGVAFARRRRIGLHRPPPRHPRRPRRWSPTAAGFWPRAGAPAPWRSRTKAARRKPGKKLTGKSSCVGPGCSRAASADWRAAPGVPGKSVMAAPGYFCQVRFLWRLARSFLRRLCLLILLFRRFFNDPIL